MGEKFKSKSWLIGVFAAIIMLSIGWYLVDRMEGKIPSVAVNPSIVSLGRSQKVNFTVSDAKSGVRKIEIGIVQGEKENTLFDKSFSSRGFGRGGDHKREIIDLLIEPEKLGLAEGRAVLRITAWDHSLRGWWKGNKTQVEKPLMVDFKPPRTEVLTTMHNVNQGGTGLVIYKLSETCSRDGVMVGEHFYPGHSGLFDDDGIHAAFFALEHTQGPETKLVVLSTDRAGNTSRTGFPNAIRRKAFKKDSLPISDGFLDGKMPEFKLDAPENKPLTNLEKYLIVNRDVRKENFKEIVRVTAETENTLYWEGDFLRLPNSAPRAGFADFREYFYNGAKIDEQTHMGVDLASLQQSPVPAANAGKVVFTDNLGIYGNSVLLDHGFGLFSMYSHLSHISVDPGQMVARGEVVGKTGTTGLAGGDHLHFSILVHDTFVNPIEWWDAHWIRDNITAKIREVKSVLNENAGEASSGEEAGR